MYADKQQKPAQCRTLDGNQTSARRAPRAPFLGNLPDASALAPFLNNTAGSPGAADQPPPGDTIQRAVNRTGLPDQLKTGVENLSGYSMNDVRVHYNSSKPAQLQALAYTQGSDIHVAPGQEQHLPHEAWHVVQQKQGRVQPTMQMKGVNVNDNEGLEREADVMGSLIFNNNPKRNIYKTGKTSITIQKYTKIHTTNGIYYQADPGTYPNPMIMTKENEAGTIYLRNGIEIPDQLNILGINKITKNNIKDPLDDIIPNTKTRPNFSQIRQGYIVEKKQKTRTNKNKSLALDILNRQCRFLNRLNGFLTQIRSELNSGNQDNLTKISNNIKIFLDRKTGNLEYGFYKKRRRTIGALGMDIINAAFALYEISSAGNFATLAEKLQIIDALESDISLRIDQVYREIETVDYEPILKTGCDVSAIDRMNICNDIKKQEAGFDKGPFQEAIGWAYHFSSQINLGDLTHDTLFIEDAVGKSSDADEMANSHWFARLYGAQQVPPPLGGALRPIVGGPSPIAQNTFVPVNKFNNLTLGIKNDFFSKRGLVKNNSWKIFYVDHLEDNKFIIYGHLTITINDDFNFEYNFKASKNKTLTEAMQDFLIQTANNVVDGMLIEEFAHRGYLRSMRLAPTTATQDIRKQMKTRFVRRLDLGEYKLEDFQ